MRWTVEVTLRYGEPGPAFVPSPAPAAAAGRGRAWYRGDMHLHTVHSDGQRLPEETVAAARAAGLDFIVSTEHNTSSASGVWGRHAGPDLLIVDGQEITTRNGHGVIGRFVREIHRAGGLAVVAHPFCPFPGCSWKFGYDGFDGIEVWNGSWTADDEVSLRLWDGRLVHSARDGAWVPAVGNSDAHRESEAVGLPQNVVLADGLERRAVLAGVREGRLWMAESAAVDLSFGARGQGRSAGVGERLAVDPDATVSVRLDVRGAPGCTARLCTDEGQVLEARLPADGPGTVTWSTTPQASVYVRAEVRRPQPTPTTPDTVVALTNPVFLGDL